MTSSRAQLFEWFDQLSDGALTETDSITLHDLVCSDSEIAQLYVEYMEDSASLLWSNVGQLALAELQELQSTDNAQEGLGSDESHMSGFVSPSRQRISDFLWRPTVQSMAAAALVMGLLITAMAFMAAPIYRAVTRQDGGSAYETVARVTGTYQAVWAEGDLGSFEGAHLYVGRRLDLTSGLAEVTFDNGARVVIAGPAVFRLDSANSGTLEQGKVVARVPEQAKGFAVQTEDAIVVDLGTEFGVEVLPSDGTRVAVFAGEVELRHPQASDAADASPLPMRLKASAFVLIKRDRTSNQLNVQELASDLAAAEFPRGLPQPAPVLWLKADAIAGLGDGDAVTSWRDSSAHGNHATAGVGTLPTDTGTFPLVAPTYHTNVLGGKPVVRFHGAGPANDPSQASQMTVADSDSLDATSWTIFTVLNFGAGAREVPLAKGRTDDASVGWNYLLQSSTNGVIWSVRRDDEIGESDQASVAGANAENTFSIHTGWFAGSRLAEDNDDPNCIQAYRNGALNTPYMHQLAQTDAPLSAFENHEPLWVGVNPNPIEPRPFSGGLAELLIFDVALTRRQVRDVCAYLGAKYGIEVAPGGNAARGLALVSGRPAPTDEIEGN